MTKLHKRLSQSPAGKLGLLLISEMRQRKSGTIIIGQNCYQETEDRIAFPVIIKKEIVAYPPAKLRDGVLDYFKALQEWTTIESMEDELSTHVATLDDGRIGISVISKNDLENRQA